MRCKDGRLRWGPWDFVSESILYTHQAVTVPSVKNKGEELPDKRHCCYADWVWAKRSSHLSGFHRKPWGKLKERIWIGPAYTQTPVRGGRISKTIARHEQQKTEAFDCVFSHDKRQISSRARWVVFKDSQTLSWSSMWLVHVCICVYVCELMSVQVCMPPVYICMDVRPKVLLGHSLLY